MWAPKLKTRHKACHRQSDRHNLHSFGFNMREVRGSISSNHVMHEKCRDLRLRRRQAGGMGELRPPLIKIFFAILKSVSCFLETISTGGFITPTVSKNRFPLTVLSYPPVKIIISTSF
jgi:hypothetical protein